ncbi:putative multicopper oxidase family protein [Lyophyllum shimeji]|uniref:laccase n=1 Tax=Lyophyllum shimeji TaxID=47721 RepID=A0A9P3PRJ2_LYOSH|nr:putative multicopper oxidase family protein [Lyophyllum shimeji]
MLSTILLLGAAVLSLFPSAHAAVIGPTTDLTIKNVYIAPDGFNRSTVLADGIFPGPVIRGNKGDRFKINVLDRLTDPTMLRSTSIHWHGIHQNQSTWADGVSFVTQCPIAANDSFLYDFTIPDQAGTFWYHSHLATQYCDGLRGAFIVNDPDDPHRSMYDIDNESTIITLADWYHEPAKNADASGVPLTPYATLINGKGRWVNGTAVPLSVVNVVPGVRYRFRIIAMSCDTNFVFSIDQHTFTVIEADGENTAPLDVDSVQIYAGQRYSLVMTANQPVGNYWIRANPDARGYPGFDGGRNSGILRYVGAPVADPTTNDTSTNPLKESNLHALENPAAPGAPYVGGADVNLLIRHDFDFNTFHYTMNGYPFIPPTVPALLQILSGAQTAQDLLPNGSYYELPRNKVIELTLPGTAFELGGPHPFHLHGHSFSVVRSGDSDTYNYVNPVRRDTVNTGFADGNATIRFVTDNSGPWFLHCHIDWHLELGLAIVFAEDIPGIKANTVTPDAWDNLCPRYDSLTSDQL